MLTKGRFIALIADSFLDTTVQLQKFREAGWIEEQDILGCEDELDRRTAARIIHMFMRRVLEIRDMEDITPAYQLRDLFDCRVCAGHIAEVYMRGIIPAVELNGMKIFDVFRTVSEEEAAAMIEALRKIQQS